MAISITSIDKAAAQAIQKDVAAAVQSVCEKYGLKLAGNSCTFNVADLRVSLTLAIAGEEAAKTNWNAHCKMFGLKPEHFGAKLHTAGREYIITGLNTRKRGKPILATRDGKTYIFDDTDVRKLLDSRYEWEKQPTRVA